MSNELSILHNKNNLPAYLRQEMESRDADSWDDIGRQSVPRIKLDGRKIVAAIGGTELYTSKDPIEGVLVEAGPMWRTYYESTYQKGSTEKPTCFSIDGGVKPSPDAISPQSSRCDTCPMNVNGSSKTMADKKACRYYQPIAIWVPGPGTDDILFRAVLPATAIFGETVDENGYRGLNRYVNELRAAGAKPSIVKTEIGVKDGDNLVLGFKALDWLTDEDQYKKVRAFRKSDECANLLQILPDVLNDDEDVAAKAARPAHIDADGVDTRRTQRAAREEPKAPKYETEWPVGLDEVAGETDDKDTFWHHEGSNAYFYVPAGETLPDWDKCTELTESQFVASIEAQAQAQADAERELKAKREAEAKAKREAEEKAKREAEEQAQREAEEQAQREAEAKAKASVKPRTRTKKAAAEPAEDATPAPRGRTRANITEPEPAAPAARSRSQRRTPAASDTAEATSTETPATRVKREAAKTPDPEAPVRQKRAVNQAALEDALLQANADD